MLAIHVENPVKTYGSRHVLDGVNIDVPEGEFYALMGPNSSGKTTGIRHQMKILSIDEVEQ